MAVSAASLLTIAVTAYGLFGAKSSLLQARQIVRRRDSGNVSLGFLTIVAGGYLLWLLYGVALQNIPLILVDSVGLVCSSTTYLLAVRFRKSGGRHKAA
jgi:MtN3 and saliva related transmembrane protein